MKVVIDTDSAVFRAFERWLDIETEYWEHEEDYEKSWKREGVSLFELMTTGSTEVFGVRVRALPDPDSGSGDL